MDALTIGSDGDRVVVFSAHTGRAAHLQADTWARWCATPDAPELRPLRGRLEALGISGRPPLADWIPCRSRCVLLLPDLPELWVPLPDEHTAGGHAYRSLPLSEDALLVWRLLNDARPVRAVAERAGLMVEQVLAVLATWTTPDVQAVQLRPTPPRRGDPALARVVGVPRPNNVRPADQHDAVGGTTLATYHLDAIHDGATHFDDRETTLAHALALPHPMLDDQPYGARLRAVLRGRGWATDGPVVEVGCGDGELARDWGPSPRYLRVDLSPELLRTQARTAPGTLGVLADATRLPLPDASVELLISNEVLADLAAVPVSAEAPAVRTRLDRYGLQPLPAGWHNLGAWQLVEEVARVLAPGGRAVLTEFGVESGVVQEATQLDHPEVAIHFGQLRGVAERLGLRAEVLPLPQLLAMVPGSTWLSSPSWMALRARARSLGVHLPARAWTPDTLASFLPFPVDGLSWVAWTHPGPGPLPTRFYALLLERPPSGSSAPDS